MGPSELYDHLAPAEAIVSENDLHNIGVRSIMNIVCQIMDLKEEEVSGDVPLTSYGLDSLSATALSFSLRPLIQVSQIQLLSGMTIKDLQGGLEK